MDGWMDGWRMKVPNVRRSLFPDYTQRKHASELSQCSHDREQRNSLKR